MLVCTQLKLSERRSAQFNRCSQGINSVVTRPCTLKNIAEVPSRISSVYSIPQKRSPELRIVSLNLEEELYSNKTKPIKRPPQRMPLFCVHFKRVQKNNHKDEPDFDDDFLVRGVEVGTGNGNSCANLSEEAKVLHFDSDRHRDDLKSLQDGMQIELTDCCQCVCDLFNSNFQISHEDHDFGFATMETCISSRSHKTKEVVVPIQKNNILDPNILKVIRVTMNTKN